MALNCPKFGPTLIPSRLYLCSPDPQSGCGPSSVSPNRIRSLMADNGLVHRHITARQALRINCIANMLQRYKIKLPSIARRHVAQPL